jgi:hypothetical protein
MQLSLEEHRLRESIARIDSMIATTTLKPLQPKHNKHLPVQTAESRAPKVSTQHIQPSQTQSRSNPLTAHPQLQPQQRHQQQQQRHQQQQQQQQQFRFQQPQSQPQQPQLQSLVATTRPLPHLVTDLRQHHLAQQLGHPTYIAQPQSIQTMPFNTGGAPTQSERQRNAPSTTHQPGALQQIHVHQPVAYVQPVMHDNYAIADADSVSKDSSRVTTGRSVRPRNPSVKKPITVSTAADAAKAMMLANKHCHA